MDVAALEALTAEFHSALTLENTPALPLLSVAEIQRLVHERFDFEHPHDLRTLIEGAADLLRRGAVHTPHPRYFGLFNPAVTEASAAGDVLVAAFNPQLAAYSHAPGAQEIERHTLRQLAHRMGLPGHTAGYFTSGGSEANQTAVLLALTRHFPGFGDEGVQGSPTIYVSELAHDSFTKIAHTCGIGRRAVRKISTDDTLRMSIEVLEAAVEEDRQAGRLPFLVVGTAGTTAAGAIDPLPELSQFAEREGLWFHADAAWGGGALLSPTHRHLLEGIDKADSITFDAHKWLSVPMGSGMFFTRHPQVQAETFRVSASYMPSRTEHGLDQFLNTIQWSRRSIGMKVAMSLANLGWSGYANLINRQFSLGHELRSRLEEAGWQILNKTELPLVLFTHPKIENGETALDQVLDRVYAQNDAWISIAPVKNGQRALRACITSLHSRSHDLARLLEICNAAVNLPICDMHPE